jgi:hypothetical protein
MAIYQLARVFDGLMKHRDVWIGWGPIDFDFVTTGHSNDSGDRGIQRAINQIPNKKLPRRGNVSLHVICW